MPVLKRPDGEIHYEEYGQGYPILLFAPGGMRSRAEMWHDPAGGPPRSWSDWTKSLAGSYRVIAMDQRNAGRSRTAKITPSPCPRLTTSARDCMRGRCSVRTNSPPVKLRSGSESRIATWSGKTSGP